MCNAPLFLSSDLLVENRILCGNGMSTTVTTLNTMKKIEPLFTQ